MQVSLIGLRHLEQARIPISARLNSGSGWMDGMMLALDQAGARHSQCLIRDGDGKQYALPGCGAGGQYWSVSEINHRQSDVWFTKECRFPPRASQPAKFPHYLSSCFISALGLV
jgi:hypothetical protein